VGEDFRQQAEKPLQEPVQKVAFLPGRASSFRVASLRSRSE